MADININDSGSVAAGKINEKLLVGILESDSGSSVAAKINTIAGSGYIGSSDSGSAFANKINSIDVTTRPIRLMTINVGHYADGRSSTPSFNADTYAAYVQSFNTIIDSIDADVIFVQEYSENVYLNNAAKDVLFGKYEYYIIGTISGYIGNAVFSKTPMTLIQQIPFSQSNTTGRYFQLIEISINEQTVGIVNAHLDTTNNGNNYRNQQFGEIANCLKNYDYAIFGSDSNVARVQDDGLGGEQWNVLNDWVRGGTYNLGNIYGNLDCGVGYGGGEYTFAIENNNSFLGTWPTTRCYFSGYEPLSCPCDNIAAKGFAISNTTRLDSTDNPSNDVTDHCLAYADFTMIE